MAEKSVDFDKFENKYKLSLLQVEKRFVDLEGALGEINQKIEELSKVSAPVDLQQRVSDLEDLILVEQAGIMELKKLLEQPKEATVTIPQEFKEKIDSLETRLNEILNKITTTEKKDIGALQEQLDKVVEEVAGLRTEFNKKVLDIKEDVELSKKTDVNFQFLSSKIEALKEAVEDVNRKKVEADIKIANMEKILNDLQNKFQTENYSEEVNRIRKDWLLVSGRVDSLESVIQEISETIPKLEVSLTKFDTFEKASLLSKDMETKIEQFKFLESEIRRLSSKVEMIYENIDKRMDDVRKLEKFIPEIKNSIASLTQEIDKNRVDILTRVKREEFKDLERKIEEFRKFEKSIPEIKNWISSMKQEIEKEKLDSKDRVRKADLDIVAGNVNRIHEEINKKLSEMETKQKYFVESIKNVSPEKQLNEIREIIKTQEVKLSGISSEIEKFDSKMKSLRNDIMGRVSEVQAPVSPMLDSQIAALLDRLIFLESRIAAIEKLVQDTIKIQPIVLE